MKQPHISTKDALISVLSPNMSREKPKLSWDSVSVKRKYSTLIQMPKTIQKLLVIKPVMVVFKKLKKKLAENQLESIKLLPPNSKSNTILIKLFNTSKNVLMPLRELKTRIKKLSAIKKQVTFMRNQAILKKLLIS